MPLGSGSRAGAAELRYSRRRIWLADLSTRVNAIRAVKAFDGTVKVFGGVGVIAV